jgi:glycerol-3-phosphate dehydrogenase
MPFSRSERQSALDSLSTRPPELLIIGGGVVGCSVAAHAARLGLNVLLLEREDFASGSSGHSTGLAHAGLRYLAQGRVLYVFHESRERRRLQQLAPHWVKPFNFLYPVYSGDAFPLWMVRLGTWIYDRMAWVDAFLAHAPSPRPFETQSPETLTRRLPSLNREGLQGATEYFVDAQLPDHQFTLSFALDAAAHGARIVTHAEVEHLREKQDGTYSIECRDKLTNKVIAFETSLVLNCSGSWIDAVRHRAGLEGTVLSRSRGTHLVVDRLAEDPLIFSSPEKGRVFFVLPAGSDASVIGTTDIFETESPDDGHPSKDEVQSLLGTLKRFFPAVKPVVRSLYWGVRPLYKQPGHSHDASREHRLIQENPRFWSLPGVKLTAGRLAGEEGALAAYGFLRGAEKSAIDLGVLPGADRADRLNTWLLSHPDEQHRVADKETWQVGEAGFCAAEEMALTLNDFLWRRTKWPLYRDLSEEALDQIARSMGNVLQWTEEETDRQKNDFHRMLKLHRL